VKHLATDEDTLRRLLIELNWLEGASDEFQSRLNIIDAGLTELQLAGRALEGLRSEAKGSPLFVPIGGGSYVKAEVSDAKKVVVGIGAGIAIEKTVEEAKESVGNQLAQLERVRQTVQQQLLEVIQRMEEVRTKINDLSSKVSEGKRSV